MSNTKLNEVKKMIRAILIAEKSNGMPLRILERKFCDTVGKSVPLFGYPDTAALLNTLDDTVYTVCYCSKYLIFFFLLLSSKYSVHTIYTEFIHNCNP